MVWLMKIAISAVAAFMSGISILLAYFGVNVFYQEEIAQLPPVEAGSLGPAFSSLISAIIIGLSVMPVLFIIFLIFYKRLNLLGLLLGAGFGFWLIRLVNVIDAWTYPFFNNIKWPYTYFHVISIVCLLAGLFFVKRDTKWFSLGGTVAGAASGFLIAYWSVVGYRWLDNTLTSYRNFDSTESATVVIGVLVFAVIGNVADKKYSWHLTKKHKESIG